MKNEEYANMFNEAFGKYMKEAFENDSPIGRAFAAAIDSALSDVMNKMVQTRPFEFEDIVRLGLIIKGACEAYNYYYVQKG